MINMDGPEHAEEKKSIIRDFSGTRVAELRPRLRAEANRFIDAMLDRPEKPVDLVRELSFPFAWRLQELFLGVSTDEMDTMRQNLMDLLVSTSTEDEEKAVAARLHQHVAGVIAEKEETPGDDMISHLIEHHRATRGGVDRYTLASMLLSFTFGVHNSVATMISLGVLTLLTHPAERAVLLDKPDRMAVAVNEMLRYFSINDATPMRLALEDVHIDGTLIKAGDGVVVPTMPVNRDPEVCPFPNRLDLLREEPTRHLAFGYGPHRCAAQRLAPALLEVVYTTLFERVPTLELAVDEAELTYEYHSIQAFGPSELPVTW
jgi:pentalenic acid synthase